MRILVAPDRFAGVGSVRAAAVLEEGWAQGAPHDDVVRLPLSDAGPGFLEAVRATRGGEVAPVTVTGPAGAPVPAPVLLVDGAGGRTAFVEAGQVLGAHLLPAGASPGRSDRSSLGLGQVLRSVLDQGVRRVVVAVGGAATHDGGAGLLAGLGLPALALRGGARALDGLTPSDLDGLVELRRELAGVDLLVAVNTDVHLLGLHGASATLGREVAPEHAQDLERSLSAYAHAVGEVVARDVVRRDLLAPAGDAREHTRRLAQLPGAGAGGGLGFGLAALGGRLRPGAAVTAEAVDLADRIAAADLVLTGVQALDGHALHDGVVATVAAAALDRAVPVVAVAGEVHAGRREWGAAGLAGVYAVAERPGGTPAATEEDAVAALRDRARRVARTWSR